MFKNKHECKNAIKEIYRTVSIGVHFSVPLSIFNIRENNHFKFNFHYRKQCFSIITGISEKAFNFPKLLQVTKVLDVQWFASSYCVWVESIDRHARCRQFDRHPMLQLSLNV